MNSSHAIPEQHSRYFDDDFVPQVQLEESLNMGSLQRGEGAEFAIDTSQMPIEYEGIDDTDQMEYYNPEVSKDEVVLAENDDDDESSMTPFERWSSVMVDITTENDGGVLKKVIRQGIGDVIDEDSFVTVHYNAYLEEQAKAFDSTMLRGKPLRFALNKGSVTAGLDIATASMRVNEISRFLFKPMYFLGEDGCPPRVPQNSTVMFIVELKSSEASGGADEYYSMTESQRREAPFSIIKQVALREKNEGNSLYKNERYLLALKCYTRAIRVAESCRLKDEPEEKTQQKFLIVLYKNGALCSLKLKKYKHCLMHINKAIYIDHKNAQCLYVKGKALRLLGEFDRAKKELLKARTIKPNDHDIAKELKQLDTEAEKCEEAQKAMCRNMFGNMSVGEEKKKKSGPQKQKEASSYKDIVVKKLQEFKDDNERHCLILPSDLSMAQLGCVGDTCLELGLEIETKGNDTNVHYMVIKPAQGVIEPTVTESAQSR